MKRAIVLLSSAAILGMGCGHTCDFRDIALYWHFPTAGGELSCSDAGVASIRITIDGNVEGTFSCLLQDVNGNPVQGILLTDFGSRAYQFLVEGLDAGGSTIYTDSFTYTPTLCGTNTVDRTLVAAGGDMTLAYAFTDATTCTTPRSGQSPYSTTFIWFSLTGPTGQVYSSATRTVDPTALACGARGAAIFFQNAPLGTYTLNGIEEVEILGNSQAIVYHYNCVTTSLTHAASGDTFQVSLVPQQTGGTNACNGLQ